jgi:glycerol transport system permease protein
MRWAASSCSRHDHSSPSRCRWAIVYRAQHAQKRLLGVRSAWSLMSLPLLIPWNVVGTIWQIFGRADIGLARLHVRAPGPSSTTTPSNAFDAWLTHRADGCVALDLAWSRCCAYAGLQSIPDAYYQAAKIDQGQSRWSVFRYIELPKMQWRADDRHPATLHGGWCRRLYICS